MPEHQSRAQNKLVNTLCTTAILSSLFIGFLPRNGQAHWASDEIHLQFAHYGTAITAGPADTHMKDHCEELFDKFKDTGVTIDYEINTGFSRSFATLTIAGEVIALTYHPIKAHYKFISNSPPPILKDQGAQSIIFRINRSLRQPTIEVRFSTSSHYECHLIASAEK